MQTLDKQIALVTGGSRGLGLGVVEALVARGARVTVVARTTGPLMELQRRLDVTILPGDAAQQEFAESTLARVRPSVLVLNAGAIPVMAPLHEQTWESFSESWNADVQATFHWVRAALRLPLAPASRVLLSSSGAAIAGSPLSGGYAGAKRTIGFLAQYANDAAKSLGLDIRFQALLPRQIVGATALGRTAVQAYARRAGKTTEEVLAGFGKPLEPHDYGEHVAHLLTRSQYESASSFGIRGETGIEILEA
ncbi:MAG: SDR family oxidoreductase [Proteobacteria bacterium]|nr:SDR family oxidoreductase [Pseudomonadota bacterium]